MTNFSRPVRPCRYILLYFSLSFDFPQNLKSNLCFDFPPEDAGDAVVPAAGVTDVVDVVIGVAVVVEGPIDLYISAGSGASNTL